MWHRATSAMPRRHRRPRAQVCPRGPVPDCLPDSLRGRRHFQVANAEFGKGVHERVGDGRQGPDAAGLARPFDAKRVGLCRHRMTVHLHTRDVVSARHGIVHERAGQLLARTVEPNVFHQDLPDALRHPAMDLSMQQHGIEHGPDVVDDGVARDLGLPSIGIDLDLAHMTAVRIVFDVGSIDGRRRKAGLHILRKLGRVERFLRNLLDRERLCWFDCWKRCRPRT